MVLLFLFLQFILSLIRNYFMLCRAKKISIYMPYVGIGFAVIGILYAFYFIYYKKYMNQSLELLDLGV